MQMNQVTLGTTDYAASVAFYQRLGLTLIVDSPPSYARFECPAPAGGEPATVSISEVSKIPETEYPLVYFETETLDETVERLRAAGVKILSGPADQSWLWREADIEDPCGNRIRLYHAGENRRFPPWRVTP